MEVLYEEKYLDICYRILSSAKNDNITEIRKKFYYKLSYLEAYWVHIGQAYMSKDKSVNSANCVFDLKSCEAYIQLICISYQTVLLHQLNEKEYLSSIKEMHEFTIVNLEDERIAVLENEMTQNREEITMSNHRYIGDLLIYNGFWVEMSSFSLNKIIQLERQTLDFCDVVTCYTYKEEPTYQENFFALIKK